MTRQDQKEKNQKVADTIKDFCIKHELTSDMRIYFNGICYDFDSDGKMTIIKNIKASKYFEYANDEGVSVSTEGGLYEALSGSFGWTLEEMFVSDLNAVGVYYEKGESWNFSCYSTEEGDC